MYPYSRIFISGGVGVIGTSLVRRLIETEAHILIGDLKPRPSWLPSSVQYRQGDLNEMTRAELEAFGPDVYFHLAATFERSTESYEFWEENDRHNVQLSHHLLEIVKDMPSLKRIVFASSYLIYDPDLYQFASPASEATPLRETDRISPRNLCGMAKLMHEKELAFVQQFTGGRLTTVSARIYRVYGKDSRDIVSRWIQALLRGETIQVYRKEGMFDYIYADEVAEGLFRLASSSTDGIVNLGNGNARRVEELLAALRVHFPEMNAVEGESDIPFEASEANMTRYEQQVGWRPVRQLEDVLPEMIEHYKQVLGRQKEMGLTTSGTKDRHVLISSLSRKISLIEGSRRALVKLGANAEVVGGDSDDGCLGGYFADRMWIMPKLDTLSVSDLVQKCRELGIRYIIPSRDGELEFYAKHAAALRKAGIDVMVSPLATVEMCLDKLAFAKEGERLGFPVIPASASPEDLAAPRFVVKERYGAGSRNIGLGLSLAEAVKHAELLESPVYQPHIEGQEISVDLYVTSAGRCKGVVLRRRIKVVNGESQVTETFRDEKLETMFAEFAERIDIYGHAVFQAIVTASGSCRIIECNARWGGASHLAVAAGLDSLYWFFLEAGGANLDEYLFLRAKPTQRLVRYPEDRIQ